MITRNKSIGRVSVWLNGLAFLSSIVRGLTKGEPGAGRWAGKGWPRPGPVVNTRRHASWELALSTMACHFTR